MVHYLGGLQYLKLVLEAVKLSGLYNLLSVQNSLSLVPQEKLIKISASTMDRKDLIFSYAVQVTKSNLLTSLCLTLPCPSVGSLLHAPF